jgi:hypothetical protein
MKSSSSPPAVYDFNEIEAAPKFIAADLGDGVVSARTMMKQAKHLALTELRFLLHGLTIRCALGGYFKYALCKINRRNPI